MEHLILLGIGFLKLRRLNKLSRLRENVRHQSQIVSPVIWPRQWIKSMAPVARKVLPEEKLLASLTKSWAYLAYTIKQLIILFPNLWAGYEMGRRKEEKRKKQGQLKNEVGDKGLKLFIESLKLDCDSHDEAPSDEVDMLMDFLEDMVVHDLLAASAGPDNDTELFTESQKTKRRKDSS